MSTHTLKLQPTDVLFFKDGRPMDGATSGHGAAWPLPNVLDAALHAALHRSGLGENAHKHCIGHSSTRDRENESKRTRLFGSLQSAGPFPIDQNDQWYFPRPADADQAGSSRSTHLPLLSPPSGSSSSLPSGLSPVVNTRPPSKDKAEPWLSKKAYEAYLAHTEFTDSAHFLKDDAIYKAEHNIGIGIDANSGTQDGTSFYSASYLRLKSDFSLGLISSCMDKNENDLLEKTFQNSGHTNHILAGGQQRTCTLYRNKAATLPLPIAPEIKGNLVRWTLLTPAIFPEITGKHTHPGGWLPTWICPDSKQVMLTERPTREKGQCRTVWRKTVENAPKIPAKLVAALIPRAIPVTGWSLGKDESTFGAKSTHLAVPAGAVYYFECDSEAAATQLAAALNWHGANQSSHIVNRRSSLLGEKGFGLGVCSTWKPHH